MRICHISTVHRRDDIRIYRKEITSLLQANFSIDYITKANPAEDETIDDSRVNILPVNISSRKLVRIISSTPKTLWTCFKSKADIFHAHDPELIVTLILLKLFGKKTILDVHEDYEQQIVDKLWIPTLIRFGFILPMFKLIHMIAKRVIDQFVVVTEHIASKYPVQKTYIVQNFPLESEIDLQLYRSKTHDTDRKIDMAYFGEISEERNFIKVLTAYLELHKEGHNISFKLGGRVSSPGIDELIHECQSIDGFEYLSWIPRDKMLSILTKTKLGFVLFKPLGNHINAQPNKIFEYMASGVLILCSNFKLWNDIVVENEIGLSVDPNDKEAIKKGIIEGLKSYSTDRSNTAQLLVNRKYNWNNEFSTLLKCYENISI